MIRTGIEYSWCRRELMQTVNQHGEHELEESRAFEFFISHIDKIKQRQDSPIKLSLRYQSSDQRLEHQSEVAAQALRILANIQQRTGWCPEYLSIEFENPGDCLSSINSYVLTIFWDENHHGINERSEANTE